MRLLLCSLLFCCNALCGAQPVKLLCNWLDTTRAPLNPAGQRFNECWGFVQGGKEYGVIASTTGAHVIDIDACKEVAYAPAGNTNAVHRDYKTYRHYLYAVADEGNTAALQIYDLNFLPDSLHLVYQSDPAEFNRCHKIFIDTATAKLYCASFSLQGILHDFMRVYSLADPLHPLLVARYNYGGDVHDVYVRNDTAYCSSSYFGYVVADFSKVPAGPVAILGGLLHYDFQGFNHSSWIGADGIGVMADETFGKPLKVIDTRDPRNIKVPGHFGPRDTASTSVPHNPYIRGHFAYISYYQDGFQLYDISDPANPRQAGFYATYQGTPYQGYAGAWGCYPFLPSRRVLVSDMQRGLFVLDADEAIGIHKSAQFSMYPNPATSTMFLQLPYGNTGELRCDIMDMTGRRMMAWQQSIFGNTNPPLTIPLPPTMPAGMYVLRAAIGGQSLTAKFTKL